MCMYASSWVKERAFIEKVTSRCFCWFLTVILVHQNGTPIWRLHTQLYKGAWNASANNSETVGHKDLNISFLGFFHWTVSNLFFCCMTVKTIYTQKLEDQDSNRQIVSVWTDSSAFLSRHVTEANCRASRQTNVPSFMGFLFFLGAEDKDGKFVSRTLLTSQLTVFSLSLGRYIVRLTTWNICT